MQGAASSGYKRLEALLHISQKELQFKFVPEYCDDMDMLMAAIKVDKSAYMYASPRLRRMFSMAMMAAAYHYLMGD